MNRLLGHLTSLWFIDGRNAERERVFPLAAAPSLVVKPDGKLLVVYPTKILRAATSEEERTYAKLHWGESGKGDVVEGEIVRPPVRSLGTGLAITYTTKKLGDGSRLADYEHEWGEGALGKWAPPLLVEHRCDTPRCPSKGRLALRGGTYRVTERGIVG